MAHGAEAGHFLAQLFVEVNRRPDPEVTVRKSDDHHAGGIRKSVEAHVRAIRYPDIVGYRLKHRRASRSIKRVRYRASMSRTCWHAIPWESSRPAQPRTPHSHSVVRALLFPNRPRCP